MGSPSPRPLVLDSGALVAFERSDRRVRRLIELATAHDAPLHVPAGVVAQVWRDGSRQTRLTRLLNSGVLSIRALDLDEARAAGVLCGLADSADVVDASVALLARRYRAAVVTSDVSDLRRLDPRLVLIAC